MKKRRKYGTILIFVVGLIMYLLGLFLLFGSTLSRNSFLAKLFQKMIIFTNLSLVKIKMVGIILFLIGFILFMVAVVWLYKNNELKEDNKNLIIEGKADVITIIVMTYVMIFMLVICLIFNDILGALLFGVTIIVQGILNYVLIMYYNKTYRR